MSVKGPTYEENMRRLEELVHQLEKGDISLEEGLTAFEEGVGLIKVCRQQLERAASRIQAVTQDGDLVPLANYGEE